LNFANGKSYQKPKVHDRVESFESPSSNLRLTYTGTNPDLSAKILTNVIAELAISMVASNKRTYKDNCLFKRAYSRFAKDKDSIQSVKESYETIYSF
jgi:hypothetical protein